MNTTSIEEQTEYALSEMNYQKAMRENILCTGLKVTNLTQEIAGKGEELARLIGEETCTKEHLLGHALIMENIAGKLLQLSIQFRHEYILYRANVEA